MRQRRGEFYIFQQHDDQVSPSYIADLVDAAARFPDATVCFAEMHSSGLRTLIQPGVALSGPPLQRALTYLENMDHVPFRGLIRSSALASTSGLLLADFNPFDSFGTEIRFMTELALLGEFRFVPGPIYYKRIHGENIHLTRSKWSEQQKLLAWGCFGAWMIEVIVPVGETPEQRRHLLHTVAGPFSGYQGSVEMAENAFATADLLPFSCAAAASNHAGSVEEERAIGAGHQWAIYGL